MQKFQLILTGCLVLLATVAGAAVHNSFGIYGGSELLKDAGARLSRDLPKTVGAWQMAPKQPIEADVVEMLRCTGYLNYSYLNSETGQRISVAVLVGPSGAIAAHTPEICYSSTHFAAEGSRREFAFTDKTGTQHELWEVYFNSTRVSGERLLVLYGWSEGQNWQATPQPRFSRGDRPYLYKLQLATNVGEQSDANRQACEEFLAQFTVQLQQNLSP